MLACRARALLDGRLAPSVEDVLALAEPVLRHRMARDLRRPGRGRQRRRRHRPAGGAPAVIGERPATARPTRRRRAPLRDSAEQRCAASCRRCWSRPTGSPRPWRRACMAAAGSARARPSGNSAATSRATPPPASTGARAPSRDACSSARPNGKRRRASGCGATRRASMDYRSRLYRRAVPTKRDRAELILVALAALLVRGGERRGPARQRRARRAGRVGLSRLVS